MTGRKCDTTQDVIKKSIQTKAWYSYILDKSGHRNSNQLASVFSQGQRKWSNYANGSNTPNKTTLKRADALYAGSFYVFHNGPNYFGLFDSMFMDVKDGESCFRHQNIHYEWLLSAHRELNNDELIIHLKNVLSTNSFNIKPEAIYPSSALNLFAGCFLLFREARSGNWSSDRNICKLLNLVIDIWESDEVEKQLNKYRIYNDCLKWLLFQALTWCTGTIVYMTEFFGDHPDLFKNEHELPEVTSKMVLEVVNDFIEQPKDFIARLAKIIEFEVEYRNSYFDDIPKEFLSEPPCYGLADQECILAIKKQTTVC